MEIIYTFLFAISLFLILVFLLTIYKKKRAEKMLATFNNENLNQLEILFSQVSYSTFSQRGGISTKALLYYNEHLLIFTPKKNAVFSSILNSLPIILIFKNNNILPQEFNYKIIEKIRIKSDEFILTFSENSLTDKLRVEISLSSEKEISKLNELFSRHIELKN